MLNSNNRIKLYTLVATFILVSIISIMFAFRKKIFHETNKNRKTALQEGYGYYDEPITMGCITPDDLCDKSGVETTVEKCIPHPVTGKGCFDEESGTMTFKSKTTTKPCTKTCVRYGLSLTSGEEFQTEFDATGDPSKDNSTKKLFYKGVKNVIDPYYGIDYTSKYFGTYDTQNNVYEMNTEAATEYPICIPNEYTGYYQMKYTCNPRDSAGVDSCKYTCGAHKTISFSGQRPSTNNNKDVIMRYPFYVEESGDKYYYCYDEIGNNLIAPLYESGKVDSNFVFPKICYSRYITNFNQHHKLISDITYNSDFIFLGGKKDIADDTLSNISQGDYIKLPDSFTSGQNSIMIAKIGQEFMKVIQYETNIDTIQHLLKVFFLYSKTEINGFSDKIKDTFGDYNYIYQLPLSKCTSYSVKINSSIVTFSGTSPPSTTSSPIVGFFEGNPTIVKLKYSNNTWSSDQNPDKFQISSPTTFYRISKINSTLDDGSFITESILLSGSFSDMSNINNHTFSSDQSSVYKHQEVSLNVKPLLLPSSISTTEFIPYSPTIIFGGLYTPGTPTKTSLINIKTNLDYTIYMDTKKSTKRSYIQVDRDFIPGKNVRMAHTKNTDVFFMHNIAEKISDFTMLMSPYIEFTDADGTKQSKNACYDNQNKRRPDGYVVNLQSGETLVANIQSEDYNLNYKKYGYDSANCGVYGYKDSEGVVHPSHNNRDAYGIINITTDPNECSISSNTDTDNGSLENMFKLGISSDTSDNKLTCFSSYSKNPPPRSCLIPNYPIKYSNVESYDQGSIVYKELKNGQFYISMIDNNRSNLSKSDSWRQVNVFTTLLEYAYRRELIMTKNISQYFRLNQTSLINSADISPISFSSADQFSWDVYSIKNSGMRTLDPSGIMNPYVSGSNYFPDKLVDVKLDVTLPTGQHYPFNSNSPSIRKPFHMDLFLSKLVYNLNDVEYITGGTTVEQIKNTWRKFSRGLTDISFDWSAPSLTTPSGGNWVYGLRLDTRPDIIFNHNRYTIQCNNNEATDNTEYQINKYGMRESGANYYNNTSFEGNFGRKFNGNDDILESIWPSNSQRNKAFAARFGIYRDGDLNFNNNDLSLPNGPYSISNDVNSDNSGNISLVNASSSTLSIGAQAFAERWNTNLVNQIRVYFYPYYIERPISGEYSFSKFISDGTNTFTLPYENDQNYSIILPSNTFTPSVGQTIRIEDDTTNIYYDTDTIVSLVTTVAKKITISLNKQNKTKIPANKKYILEKLNDTLTTNLVNNAKEETKQSFIVPINYTRNFNIGTTTDDKNNLLTLADFNYKVPAGGDTNLYSNYMGFNFFIENIYSYSKTFPKLDVKDSLLWVNNNIKSNDTSNTRIEMVPLFGSVSLEEDNNVGSTTANPVYLYNNDDGDKVVEYNGKQVTNSIGDYEKDYETSYGTSDPSESSDPSDRTRLWNSQSMKTNEVIIGRIDEGSDEGDYRLVMLQKNEGFENLDLYLNYPRPSSVFALPEAEPLSVRPSDYCNVYCYINNIESVYNYSSNSNSNIEVGFIHIAQNNMYQYSPNDNTVASLSSKNDPDGKTQYWNKKYLPFFQSTSQTGYSRLAKMMPGKLYNDCWGVSHTPDNSDKCVGDFLVNKFLVNKFLVNLAYGNKLMPIYTTSSNEENQYIWYTTTGEDYSEDDTEDTETTMVGSVTYYEIHPYNNKTSSFKVPSPDSSSNYTPNNSTDWQSYLDNLWSPPAVLMSKDYEMLTFPKLATGSSSSYEPSQPDSSFINYENIPYYWLSNTRNLFKNNNEDLYNDMIRSIFWGNSTIQRYSPADVSVNTNYLATPYTSKKTFSVNNVTTEEDTIQTFHNPLFTDTDTNKILNESVSINIPTDKLFDALERIGQDFSVYDPSDNFSFKISDPNKYKNVLRLLYTPSENISLPDDPITLDSLSAIDDTLASNINAFVDDDTFAKTISQDGILRTMQTFVNGLYYSLKTQDSFFIVPLISSYADIDDDFDIYGNTNGDTGEIYNTIPGVDEKSLTDKILSTNSDNLKTNQYFRLYYNIVTGYGPVNILPNNTLLDDPTDPKAAGNISNNYPQRNYSFNGYWDTGLTYFSQASAVWSSLYSAGLMLNFNHLLGDAKQQFSWFMYEDGPNENIISPTMPTSIYIPNVSSDKFGMTGDPTTQLPIRLLYRTSAEQQQGFSGHQNVFDFFKKANPKYAEGPVIFGNMQSVLDYIDTKVTIGVSDDPYQGTGDPSYNFSLRNTSWVLNDKTSFYNQFPSVNFLLSPNNKVGVNLTDDFSKYWNRSEGKPYETYNQILNYPTNTVTNFVQRGFKTYNLLIPDGNTNTIPGLNDVSGKIVFPAMGFYNQRPEGVSGLPSSISSKTFNFSTSQNVIDTSGILKTFKVTQYTAGPPIANPSIQNNINSKITIPSTNFMDFGTNATSPPVVGDAINVQDDTRNYYYNSGTYITDIDTTSEPNFTTITLNNANREVIPAGKVYTLSGNVKTINFNDVNTHTKLMLRTMGDFYGKSSRYNITQSFNDGAIRLLYVHMLGLYSPTSVSKYYNNTLPTGKLLPPATLQRSNNPLPLQYNNYGYSQLHQDSLINSIPKPVRTMLGIASGVTKTFQYLDKTSKTIQNDINTKITTLSKSFSSPPVVGDVISVQGDITNQYYSVGTYITDIDTTSTANSTTITLSQPNTNTIPPTAEYFLGARPAKDITDLLQSFTDNLATYASSQTRTNLMNILNPKIQGSILYIDDLKGDLRDGMGIPQNYLPGGWGWPTYFNDYGIGYFTTPNPPNLITGQTNSTFYPSFPLFEHCRQQLDSNINIHDVETKVISSPRLKTWIDSINNNNNEYIKLDDVGEYISPVIFIDNTILGENSLKNVSYEDFGSINVTRTNNSYTDYSMKIFTDFYNSGDINPGSITHFSDYQYQNILVTGSDGGRSPILNIGSVNFPLRTFYSIQSPEWRMRTVNYVPTSDWITAPNKSAIKNQSYSPGYSTQNIKRYIARRVDRQEDWNFANFDDSYDPITSRSLVNTSKNPPPPYGVVCSGGHNEEFIFTKTDSVGYNSLYQSDSQSQSSPLYTKDHIRRYFINDDGDSDILPTKGTKQYTRSVTEIQNVYTNYQKFSKSLQKSHSSTVSITPPLTNILNIDNKTLTFKGMNYQLAPASSLMVPSKFRYQPILSSPTQDPYMWDSGPKQIDMGLTTILKTTIDNITGTNFKFNFDGGDHYNYTNYNYTNLYSWYSSNKGTNSGASISDTQGDITEEYIIDLHVKREDPNIAYSIFGKNPKANNDYYDKFMMDKEFPYFIGSSEQKKLVGGTFNDITFQTDSVTFTKTFKLESPISVNQPYSFTQSPNSFSSPPTIGDIISVQRDTSNNYFAPNTYITGISTSEINGEENIVITLNQPNGVWIDKETICILSTTRKSSDLSKLYYKQVGETISHKPYYNYIDSSSSKIQTNTSVPTSVVSPEPTVPSSTFDNMYQMFNFYPKIYKTVGGEANTVKKIFNNIYNNYDNANSTNFAMTNDYKYNIKQPLNLSSNPTLYKNIYSDFSNLTGRNFRTKGDESMIITAKITPDLTFRMNKVNVRDQFLNSAIASNVVKFSLKIPNNQNYSINVSNDQLGKGSDTGIAGKVNVGDRIRCFKLVNGVKNTEYYDNDTYITGIEVDKGTITLNKKNNDKIPADTTYYIGSGYGLASYVSKNMYTDNTYLQNLDFIPTKSKIVTDIYGINDSSLKFFGVGTKEDGNWDLGSFNDTPTELGTLKYYNRFTDLDFTKIHNIKINNNNLIRTHDEKCQITRNSKSMTNIMNDLKYESFYMNNIGAQSTENNINSTEAIFVNVDLILDVSQYPDLGIPDLGIPDHGFTLNLEQLEDNNLSIYGTNKSIIVYDTSLNGRFIYYTYNVSGDIYTFTKGDPSSYTNLIIESPTGKIWQFGDYTGDDDTNYKFIFSDDEPTYKVIAVTDTLNKKNTAYSFDNAQYNSGTSSTDTKLLGDSGITVTNIWNFLEVNETFNFKSLLFYNYTNPVLDGPNQMFRSNFIRESDTQIKLRTDVADAWSSVNDATPYQQPTPLGDSLLPAYGCLPMSGGRMVWSEITYDSSGNRIDAINGKYIDSVNNYFKTSGPRNIISINGSSGSSTLSLTLDDDYNFINGESVIFALSNGVESILNNTNVYNTLSSTTPITINVPNKNQKVFEITLTEKLSSGINLQFSSTSDNLITAVSLIIQDYKATSYSITTNWTDPKSSTSSTNTYFPSMNGFNIGTIKDVTIKGNLPELTENHGVYFSKNFFDRSISGIFPDINASLERAINPFSDSTTNFFYKSSPIALPTYEKDDDITTIVMNFYDSSIADEDYDMNPQTKAKSLTKQDIKSSVFFTSAPGFEKTFLGYPGKEKTSSTDYSEYISYSKIQDITPPSYKNGDNIITPVSSDIQFARIGGERFFYTTVVEEGDDQVYKMTFYRYNDTKIFDTWESGTNNFILGSSINNLVPTFANTQTISVPSSGVLDLRNIFGLTTKDDYNQDSINPHVRNSTQIALNDIRNFVDRLTPGDQILIEQFKTNSKNYILTVSAKVSSHPYSIVLERSYSDSTGQKTISSEGNDIEIKTQFTYVSVYRTRFYNDGNAKNAITMSNMAFTDGVAMYTFDENKKYSDYTDFIIVSKSLLTAFTVTNSVSISNIQTIYNTNFNIVLAVTSQEPAPMLDIFGTNTGSYVSGSSPEQTYSLGKQYRKYNIVYNTETENVFFEAKDKTSTGEDPLNIVPGSDTKGSTIKINSNWDIVNIDSNEIIDNKEWQPYHFYKLSDIVYRERTLLPYINYNNGLTLSEKSKIVTCLPSTYPYKLYNDDYQNLQYYKAQSQVGATSDDLDPMFYKNYSVKPLVEEFKFDTQNMKEYGNMCAGKNFVGLTQSKFDTSDYRGCDEPLSIYEDNSGVLTFSPEKMITNNFVQHITLDGTQNFTDKEIAGFFDADASPYKSTEIVTFDDNINIRLQADLLTGTTNLMSVIDDSGDNYYINSNVDTNNPPSPSPPPLTFSKIPDGQAKTISVNFRKCIINSDGDYYILYHPFTTQKVYNGEDKITQIYYISKNTKSGEPDYVIKSILQNQNIDPKRIVACCVPNKPNWTTFEVNPNSVSNDNFFATTSRDMYGIYKSNVNSLSYITQTDNISTKTVTTEGVTLYSTSSVPNNTKMTQYSSIINKTYYAEKLIGGINMYIGNLSLNKTSTYTQETNIDGYNITFYTNTGANISTTKPSYDSIDSIYYTKLQYNGKGPYYLFTYDGREGTNFSATKTCMNFSLNPTYNTDDTKTWFGNLKNKFVSAKITSKNKNLLLSLPNAPCNYDPKASEYPIRYLGDCYADTEAEILSQAISYIPLEQGEGKISDPGLSGKATCTGKFLSTIDKFELSNSLLLYFVPIEDRYQPSDSNRLLCRIMTFFGTEFMGWLKYNRSIEIKRDFEVDNSTDQDPAMTPAFVSYTNFNILNTKKQTKVMIGNKPVYTDVFDNIEESNAYYTANFKDEDIFSLNYTEKGGTYEIGKLKTNDMCFVVDGVINTSDTNTNITRNVSPNSKFPMVETVLTLTNVPNITKYDIYLVNISGDSNKINGIYVCTDTNILTVHEDFNTSDKIIENQLVRHDANYYKLTMNTTTNTGQINVSTLIATDIANIPNNIISVGNYYATLPSSSTGTYIVNNLADVEKNGYYLDGKKQTKKQTLEQTIFEISSGSDAFPNTHWSYNARDESIVFTEVTYLFNNLSALTNRTNQLDVQKLVGKVRFRKEYSNATGYGLSNLTLTPMYTQSDVINDNNLITELGNIRESRLASNLASENDCSLFFSYNPFTEDPIRYMYKMVKDQNVIKLESVTNIILSEITTNSSTEHIERNLSYNYRYRIDQQEQDLTSGLKLVIKSQTKTTNVSVLVTYFSNTQLGDGNNTNQEILSFEQDGNTTSGYSDIYPVYEKALNGTNDTYILFEPIKNTTNPPTFTIEVMYETTLVDTFTIS